MAFRFSLVRIVALLCIASALPAQEMGLNFATPTQLARLDSARTPFSGGTLPPVVDLSADFPPVGNQGHQSSCVAWAVAYALKSYQERVEDHRVLQDGGGNANQSAVFSPAYIYNQINHGRDAGSFFDDAFSLLKQQGAATLIDAPYDETDFLSQPSAAARADAAPFRIEDVRRIPTSDILTLKAQLNAGYPIVVGAAIDQGFQQARAGFIWNRQIGQVLGGHAMVVVGYDDNKNAFHVINSWSRNWGDNGYGWIDYAYFPTAVREAYVVRDAANGPGPVVINPVQPAPPAPPPATAIQFALNGVAHNVPTPFGPAMQFSGQLSVPAGITGQVQVVIQIYLDAGGGTKGPPVGSFNPQFAMPTGAAATGTQAVGIPPGGAATSWFAVLPYLSLNIPRGGPFNLIQTNLVAEPILFYNNFGVKSSGLIPFFVRL